MRPTFDNLARIGFEDILGLVTARVAEDDSIDFKAGWYSNGDDFRIDLSALANSGGGCIVLGVAEEEGVATEICGVGEGAENALLQMSNWAESGLRPRLQWSHRVIDSSEGVRVVALAVRRSLQGPHMVVSKHRFWKRLPVGKNEMMDVDDLRRAFHYSVSEEDDIRLSLDSLLARTTRLQPNQTALSVVVAPSPPAVGLFSPGDARDGLPLELLRQATDYFLLDSGSLRITFDGFSLAKPNGADIFEVGWDGVFRAHSRFVDREENRRRWFFPMNDLIDPLDGLFKNLMDLYRGSGVPAPIRAICAVHGCEGRMLNARIHDGTVCNRTDIVLDVAWLDFERPWFDQVVPWLDRVWNAFGFANCPILEPDGTVKKERLHRWLT